MFVFFVLLVDMVRFCGFLLLLLVAAEPQGKPDSTSLRFFLKRSPKKKKNTRSTRSFANPCSEAT